MSYHSFNQATFSFSFVFRNCFILIGSRAAMNWHGFGKLKETREPDEGKK